LELLGLTSMAEFTFSHDPVRQQVIKKLLVLCRDESKNVRTDLLVWRFMDDRPLWIDDALGRKRDLLLDLEQLDQFSGFHNSECRLVREQFDPIMISISDAKEFKMKGNVYRLTEASLGMYPEIRNSSFWSGGEDHSFLSFFFSSDYSPVGARLNGVFFGIGQCRNDLNKLMGPGDFWDNLARFCDPSTGQQKNLLAALCTVCQPDLGAEKLFVIGPTPDDDLNRQYYCSSVPDDSLIRKYWEKDPISLDQAGIIERFCHSLPHDSQFFRFYKDARKFFFVSRVGQGLFLDYYADRVWFRGSSILASFEQFLKSIDCRDVDPVALGDGSRLILVGHSRGVGSGVWIDDFCQFVCDFTPIQKVVAFDPLCVPDKKTFVSNGEGRKMDLISLKKVFDPRSPIGRLYVNDILCDDAQMGNDLLSYVSLPLRFNLKKRGNLSFCHAETRTFSTIHPIMHRNAFSSCQCHQCRAISFISARTGGYSAFLRLQRLLSKFGPVCLREKVEEYFTSLSPAFRGASSRIEKAKDVLGLGVPSVKGDDLAISSDGGNFNNEIKLLCSGKSVVVTVPVALDVPHTRDPPLDVVICDSDVVLQEFGFVPIVITRSDYLAPGYDRKRSGDWYIWTRKCLVGCEAEDEIRL